MKRIHLIAIFVLLLILAGIFIMSPWSPLNKESINGKTIKIPDGYTVDNKTQYGLKITNGTNEFDIFYHDQKTVNDAINYYTNKHGSVYNITKTEYTTSNGDNIIRTTAKRENKTEISYRDWFSKNGKIYDIKSYRLSPENDKNIEYMISSM